MTIEVSWMTMKIAIVALAALALGHAPVKPDFGLRVGNQWTYTLKSGNDESSVVETGVRFVEVKKSTYALEVKSVHSGGYEGFSYLGQDENGLLSYFNSQMRGPGVSSDIAPVVKARMPFNKGLTWKWVEKWRGQTAGNVDERELRKMDMHMDAVIVDDKEPITVPAGSYKAVHVRMTGESEAGGRTFQDHWYVFGVGLVKSVYKSPDGESSRVLTKFVPAT